MAVGRAEEYRLLGRNHPEGLRVHYDYIADLVKTLVKQASADEGTNFVVSVAMKTLENLRDEMAATKPETSPGMSEVRAKLKKHSGMRLLSFDGIPYDANVFSRFIRDFDKMVPNVSHLTAVINLVELKKCLEGEAFDLVDMLETSSRNYSLARELLNKVYGSGCTAELYHNLVKLPQVSIGDGAEFRRTFWELERILKSIEELDEDVDNNVCLRLLYLRKFSEESLISVLVKDPKISLSNIRKELRRMVRIQELNIQLALDKPSTDKPISECSPTDAASGNKKEVSNSAGVKNATESAKQNKNESAESSDKMSVCGEDDDNTPTITTLTTVCAKVSFRPHHTETKSTIVRLLLQNNAPVSLLCESAAKRLGIIVPQQKSFRLRGTLGGSFTVTEKSFELLLALGDGCTDSVMVHIADDKFGFSAEKCPAVDVADFVKAHPHLSHLNLPDPGKGRPVELYLSGQYWHRYIMNFSNAPCHPEVKEDWIALKSRFGWLVSGEVKCKYAIVASYQYDG